VAAIAWQGTVSFYPATYALVAAGVVLLVRVGSLKRHGIVAGAASLFGAVASLGLLAIPNMMVAGRDPNYGFPLTAFGPGDANFFRTEPELVVWGHVLGVTKADTLHNGVFPGAILLVLALLGAVQAWRFGGRSRTTAATGLSLTAVGAILAMGTSASGWRRYAPYRLLYELGPPFNALRDEARGWMIGLCGLSLLAGLGARALLAWLRPKVRTGTNLVPTLVATALVVLLLLEGYDPWFQRPTVRLAPVDVALSQRRGPGGVVYLPMNRTAQLDISIFKQPANLYGDTAYHRPTPNGYSGYVPSSYVRQSRELWSLPDRRALDLLKRLGVVYVVVHQSVAGSPWASLRSPRAAAPLRFLGRFGNDLLYQVPAS
jgi:hypothetical protein